MPFQRIYYTISGVGKQLVSLLGQKGRRPFRTNRHDMTAIASFSSASLTVPPRPFQEGAPHAEADELGFLQVLEADDSLPEAELVPGVPPFVFVGAESAPVAPATGAEERIDACETLISGADSSMYPTPLVSEPRALPPKTDVNLTPESMDGVTATLEGPLAHPKAAVPGTTPEGSDMQMSMQGRISAVPPTVEAEAAAVIYPADVSPADQANLAVRTETDTADVESREPEIAFPGRIGATGTAPETGKATAMQQAVSLPFSSPVGDSGQHLVAPRQGEAGKHVGSSDPLVGATEVEITVDRRHAPTVREAAIRSDAEHIRAEAGAVEMGSQALDPVPAAFGASPQAAPGTGLPAPAMDAASLLQPERIAQGLDRPPLLRTAEGPISPTISAAISNGSDRIELRLDPVELGRVVFEMTTERGQLHLIVTCERAETLDLMRRHAEQLLQDLRASGFSGSTLDFAQWSNRQERRESGDLPDAGHEEGGTGPAASPARSTYTRQTARPDGGLDLRL